MNEQIVIYESQDGITKIDVQIQEDTVWLNRQQMAELFGRDVKTIGKHINNALREELANFVVVAKFATTTPHGALEGKVSALCFCNSTTSSPFISVSWKSCKM